MSNVVAGRQDDQAAILSGVMFGLFRVFRG